MAGISQSILGEAFDSRDRIRNTFKSLCFLEFSTAGENDPSPVSLGSSEG
jgi:hypothetical protein